MMSADDLAATGAPDVDIPQADTTSLASSSVATLTNASAAIADTTHDALQRFKSTAEVEAWLIEAAIAQWGHLFGQSTFNYGWNLYPPILLADIAVPRTLNSGALSSNFDADFSTTNLQVAGVEEADIVETDGEYLYILSGQQLVIVKAGIGDELKVVSRMALDERPVGMYLSGNRLALVSSSGYADFGQPIRGGLPFLTDVMYFPEQQIRPPTTTVTVLDITDRAAPSVVQKTEMDGQLVTSRTVDGQLRLVLTNEIRLPMPIALPVDNQTAAEGVKYLPVRNFDPNRLMVADIMWWPGYGTSSVYETQEEYVARVRDEILNSIRPQIRSLGLDGGVIAETPLFDAVDVYRPESLLDRHVTTIATFDLTSNDAGPAATASIITGGQAQVYATAESLYVFAQQSSTSYEQGVALWVDQSPKTSVWKFDFSAQTNDIELVAKGEFNGRLLNQFAADEHDGYLRVVTQPYGWNSVGQSVHVLEQDGELLNVVGTIGGIAPNENLHSIRFIDDRAFFVTFRQTDPLFAVDLSDPENPELLGELHIPGFSDYLQPIDANHLLAIGRDADELTGVFQELQVSIFDVSDLTNPQLVHRYSFEGGRTTATPVTGDRWIRGDGDHHAVSYFASEQIFAMPIFAAEDLSWWWDGDQSTALFEAGHGGLQVFRLDVDAGFTPLGIIEHDTLVERSLQIGDRLYAISSGTVTVHELTNPDVRLGEVSIAADSGVESVALTMYQAPIETVSRGASEAASERPTPRADWMPISSARPHYNPPVRAAAFANFPNPRLLDAELVQALASDTTSAVVSHDASTDDEPSTDENDHDEDVENAGRKLQHRRSAFRPVTARVGR